MHSEFCLKVIFFNVRDCKWWNKRYLTVMNVSSGTTTASILKHIMGFKYRVVKDSYEVP